MRSISDTGRRNLSPFPTCRWPQALRLSNTRPRSWEWSDHTPRKGAIEQILAVCGWQLNTSFVERLNLDLRQRVAARGRRVTTLGQSEDGRQPQPALFHVSHTVVLPHARLRQLLEQPRPPTGAVRPSSGGPATPAMAAGVTDQGWTRQEVLRSRVPPWPQPHGGYRGGGHDDRATKPDKWVCAQVTGLHEVLNIRCDWGGPADAGHTGGLGEGSEYCPHPTGTRPAHIGRWRWIVQNLARSTLLTRGG